MSDALEYTIEIIGGVVLFLLAAVIFSSIMRSYKRADSEVAQNVQEKQSIVQEQDNIRNDAADVPRKEPTYNAQQVFTSIMSCEEGIPIHVDGTTAPITPDDIESARAGNEIAIAHIKSSIPEREYRRVNKFGHVNGKDYLAEVRFVIP